MISKQILDEVKTRTGVEVEVVESVKNNGVVRQGVIFKVGEFSPIIYVDEADEEHMADYIVNSFMHTRKIDVDMKQFCEKDGILKNVFPQLVDGSESNYVLKGVMSKDFLDMKVIYRIAIDDIGSTLVTKELAKKAGVTVDELHEAAMNNISDSVSIKSVERAMSGIFGMDDDEEDEGPTNGMNVVTTFDKVYGAAAIMLKEVIEKLHECYGGDFYVLPSSIHEVITIPAISGDVDTLKAMVSEINMTELQKEDILTNNVYICKNGKMEVA